MPTTLHNNHSIILAYVKGTKGTNVTAGKKFFSEISKKVLTKCDKCHILPVSDVTNVTQNERRKTL